MENTNERIGFDGKTYITEERDIRVGDRIITTHYHNNSNTGDIGTVVDYSEVLFAVFYQSEEKGEVTLNMPNACEVIIREK